MIKGWLGKAGKWDSLWWAICVGGLFSCLLILVTMFWDQGAGFIHLYATEILIGEVLAVGVLVWLTRST